MATNVFENVCIDACAKAGAIDKSCIGISDASLGNAYEQNQRHATLLVDADVSGCANTSATSGGAVDDSSNHYN